MYPSYDELLAVLVSNGLAVSDEVQEALHSYSDGVSSESYQAGVDDSYSEYDSGYTEGYDEGYSEGLAEGASSEV